VVFKNLITKKNENKLKAEITVKYNNGAKREEQTFKAYALFGKWFIRNFKKIRIVDIEVKGDY